MAQAAHVARVRSLYRQALKTSFNWCMTLEVWRPQALKIRDRFEANRNVASMREAERLCEEAERELETMRHPDPYCIKCDYWHGSVDHCLLTQLDGMIAATSSLSSRWIQVGAQSIPYGRWTARRCTYYHPSADTVVYIHIVWTALQAY